MSRYDPLYRVMASWGQVARFRSKTRVTGRARALKETKLLRRSQPALPLRLERFDAQLGRWEVLGELPLGIL